MYLLGRMSKLSDDKASLTVLGQDFRFVLRLF